MPCHCAIRLFLGVSYSGMVVGGSDCALGAGLTGLNPVHNITSDFNVVVLYRGQSMFIS